MGFETFEGYIVVAVVVLCYAVGYILKNAIKSDKINPFIPLILAVVGILFNWWLNAFAFTPEVVLGGMISGLASTGTYEAIKNMIDNARKE